MPVETGEDDSTVPDTEEGTGKMEDKSKCLQMEWTLLITIREASGTGRLTEDKQGQKPQRARALRTTLTTRINVNKVRWPALLGNGE